MGLLTDLLGDGNATSFAGFRGEASSIQAIPDGAITAVPLTETIDTGGFHAPGVASVTLGLAGVWRVTAKVAFTTSVATGRRGLFIVLNEVPGISAEMPAVVGNYEHHIALSDLIVSSGTDVIYMGAFQSSGGSLDINELSVLSAEYLGPT